MKPASAGAPIAILSPGELFGGVETMVLTLSVQLREAGTAVLPVLFHDRELAARLRAAGLEPVILAARHRYDPGAAGRLAAAIERHGSRVLHLHGYRATVTAAVAGARLGATAVKTEHGLPEPPGRLDDRAKAILNHALDVWATRRLRARVCYVTADIRRRCARDHAGLSQRLIHNGIAPLTREGRPRPADLEPGLLHAGIVGRVSAVKGIPIALRALASGAVPDRVRLDVIGTGPLEARLRRQASALGLDDRVRFHGFRRDRLDWLAHLDMLLMPSLYEGLPYTLLEAMSLGLPVVAARVGGLAEVLRHEETGLLVEPGDHEGLARALARLAGEPGLASRLGEAAAREQRERYTLERMVREYREVYEAAAALAPRGPA
jgi:glycosyltransferase involved in cell wall biosynthesis